MLSFFEELKRRHVIRIAIAYVAVGWVLVEVADFAAHTFGAPGWVVKMFTVLILLGFPLVLIAAWALEMTPEGVRRDPGAGKESATPGEPQSAPGTTGALAASPLQHSIAVLPFVNMSSDPEQEYLSDGLAEELLNLLAKIPALHVAARTSSFSFKGKDVEIRTIGERLNVSNVLEGSVRKSGNRVRITAQLIAAADGFHLWSETFDKTLDDIFAIQDEIAQAVVAALKVTLLGEVPKVRETNPEAYALYLQGMHFLDRQDQISLEHASKSFKQALELDPNYAPAWDGLAGTYYWQTTSISVYSAQEGIALTRNAIDRALAIDPNYAEAHASNALISMGMDWNWKRAEESIQTALRLEPGNARAVMRAGILASNLGRYEEALARLRQAIALNPLETGGYHYLAFTLLRLGKPGEALAAVEQELALNPLRPGACNIAARAHMLCLRPDLALATNERESDPFWREFGTALISYTLDRHPQAEESLARLVATHANDAAYQIAQVYAYRGEVEDAFRWLDSAYRERDSGLAQMLDEPLLKNIWTDPRWPIFLDRMGFPKRNP